MPRRVRQLALQGLEIGERLENTKKRSLKGIAMIGTIPDFSTNFWILILLLCNNLICFVSIGLHDKFYIDNSYVQK